MSPDLINGLFELYGSVAIWRNALQLYRDKEYKGIRLDSTAFFTAWGYWNMFYYPHLDQWWSFWGGVSIAAANSVWVGLMVHYKRKREHGA